MIGTEIEGRYRIDGEIGSGGVGTVYRGVRLADGVPVAVKVLRPELAFSPELRQRFEREARALTALSHPNIVSVSDSGVWTDTVFLVMDLLEGETLSDRLKRGPLEPIHSRTVMRQLLGALSFVHEQGLVHRDVKPANIFLEKRDNGETSVRLLDFGLAKFLTPEPGSPAVTRAGQVFGTPAYMSPEQIAGQEVDARVDIYAAGILLFEMLVGHAPFRGDASEILRQHIMEDVPVGALPASESSNEDSAIIVRATAKTKAARFANAEDMLAEFDRVPLLQALEPEGPAATIAAENATPGNEEAPVAIPEERIRRSAGFFLVRLGTSIAVVISLGAAAIVGFAVYVSVTPGRAEERHALETRFGLPLDRLSAPLGSAASVRPSLLPKVATPPTDALPAPQGAAPSAPLPVTSAGEPVTRALVRDPWISTPPELLHLLPKANHPHGLDKKEVLLVHQYNAKHLDDPRGHLLLARSYVTRRWFKDAVNEYAIALKVNDGARGDPRMLRDLLTLVEFGTNDAGHLVAHTFGETALPALDRALAGRLPNPEAKVLLEKLREELASG